MDVNVIYTENGLGPLSLACKNGNLNIVKKLVKQKANINGNYSSETDMCSIPLLESVQNYNRDIILYLFDNGADINQKDLEGASFIDYIKRIKNKLNNEDVMYYEKLISNNDTKIVAKEFIGKFTVSVEGDHANHGIEMYDYEINISENEISLNETNREFCSGSYRGIENNNKLELFYAQDDDERCVRSKAKYTIKKEGGQFYIQGVGGEGTYNEWTPLKKVTKFEN